MSIGSKLHERIELERSVNAMKLYGDLVYEWKTGGKDFKTLPLNKSEIQIGYNLIVSQNYINIMLQVQSYLGYIESGTLSTIRSLIKNKYGRKIYIDEISKEQGHSIKWTGIDMSSRRATWRKRKKNVEKSREAAEEEGFSDAIATTISENQDRLEYSWNYFQEAERNRDAVVLSATVYRIRIPRKDELFLDLALDCCFDVFTSLNIKVKQASMYNYDLQRELSPFCHEVTPVAGRMLASRLLDTKITCLTGSVIQGELPDGNIVLGVDKLNNRLVYMDTHPADHSGSSCLLIGETGSGKSCLAKAMDEQFLAEDDFLIIVDFERTEYTGLGEAYNGVVFDVGEGYYYEPLRFNSAGDSIKNDLNISALNTAIEGTKTIFSILLKKPISTSQQLLIAEAIEEVCEGNGVILDDPSTWVNTKNQRLSDLTIKFEYMYASEQYRKEYGKELLELRDASKLYFSGTLSYMFKYPLDLKTIRDEHLLIIRFGDDNQSKITGDESIAIKLQQNTIITATSELARYHRSRKESCVLQYEELQRYLTYTGSVEWLNTIWTGIRKLNGTCIGIINDPSKLKEDISALVNNSKYILIGRTEDLNSLNYLFNTSKLSGKQFLVESLGSLDRCFLYTTNTATSIFHCQLPTNYAESPIFKTRDEDKK